MTEKDIVFEDRRKKWPKNIYMENRSNLNIKNENVKRVGTIKNNLGLRSYNEVVEYLLELEKDLRDQNLIKDVKVCKKCGATISAKLDSYEGIIHQHLDTKSNCFGCITTKYRLYTNVDGPPIKFQIDKIDKQEKEKLEKDKQEKLLDQQENEEKKPESVKGIFKF